MGKANFLENRFQIYLWGHVTDENIFHILLNNSNKEYLLMFHRQKRKWFPGSSSVGVFVSMSHSIALWEGGRAFEPTAKTSQ